MAVEAFLRGCKETSAARRAVDREPHTIHKAALANDWIFFGVSG
jgi:hypothetical protein